MINSTVFKSARVSLMIILIAMKFCSDKLTGLDFSEQFSLKMSSILTLFIGLLMYRSILIFQKRLVKRKFIT